MGVHERDGSPQTREPPWHMVSENGCLGCPQTDADPHPVSVGARHAVPLPFPDQQAGLCTRQRRTAAAPLPIPSPFAIRYSPFAVFLHSPFAIRDSRFLTDPCSPTKMGVQQRIAEMGVQQRMRGCPRTEARVRNRLRQPRHVAAGRVENPPLPGSHHSPFAIRDSRFLTDPCSPTETGVQQRLRGCPRTEARVRNRLRQPRHVAPGRVENPPLPGSHHSPFAIRRFPPLATRHSRLALFHHSLFAIRHSLSLTARRSLSFTVRDAP
jgi:hypothetical protein